MEPLVQSSGDSSSQDEKRRKTPGEDTATGSTRRRCRAAPHLSSQQPRVFSLQDGERGGTSLVTMPINTGDAPPRKQAPCRMPFPVREEVARQLRDMQRDGVIQLSNSPWSSPLVMVRMKDGSHQFCIDYRALNSVTKSDTFPLPRIGDLLDQLSGTLYFSTLSIWCPVFGRSAWSHAPERRPHSSHPLGCMNFS